MAWAVKYRGEFYDLKGLYWRIDIEEDNYASSIGEMKMGGQPLTIEHMAGGDDLLFNPIKGSQATFNIISDTNFQWVGLYSAENLKYRNSIYYANAGTLNSTWVNTNFDTFTAGTGQNITSAIYSTTGTQAAVLSYVPVLLGDTISVTYTLTVNSGTAPWLTLWAAGDYASSVDTQMDAGTHTIILPSTYFGNVDVRIYATEAVNFSLSGVSVTYNNYALYWRGYLSSDYQEPYNDTPYIVSVAATDALGLLKDIKYDDSGTPYDGRRYESQVILDCLGKIGVTAFKEFVNLYEDRITDSVGYSPFDQVQIDVDVFRDMYCYEVLEEVLKKYNAVIRQSRGEFYIYRPTELIDATVYGRAFTAYNTKTAFSFDPDQLISRTVVTDIKNFQGGVLMIQAPLSKFTAEHDYGYKHSWLENWAFESTRWPLDEPDGWTNNGGQQINTTYLTRTEKDGIIFGPVSAVPNPVYNCYQQFGTNAKVTSNQFLIEFEYMFVNFSSSTATNKKVAIRIHDVAETYWLDNDTDADCKWVTTQKHVDLTEASVPVGKGSWTRFTRMVPGLPVDGPFVLTLFPTTGTGIWLAYRNVRFACTSDDMILHIPTMQEQYAYSKKVNKSPITFKSQGLDSYVETVDNAEIVSHTYISENAITGGSVTQGYMLGDVADTGITNVIEQFYGSLATMTSQQLAGVADDFVVDHAAAYVAGGVTVTSSGNNIIFTGTNTTAFTGATAIANVSGNLAGSVANTQTASAGVNRVDEIELVGIAGTADIVCEGVTQTATFSTDLSTTATNFVNANAGLYAAVNVTLTSVNEFLYFEYDNGLPELNDINVIPNGLDGAITESDTPYAEGQPQIDTVTLTGTSGSANITCDGVTQAAEFTAGTTLQHTVSWHTRGLTEGKPVIELVADEVAAQYAREKHFIQMNLRESDATAPDVNVVYNLQDSLNTYGGNNRIFAVNRGTFDVFNREWSIDLIEIL